MKDLLDVLLDRENCDPILLLDEKGKTLAFQQIAVIPYGEIGNRSLYAVLKPIDKLEGVEDNEALVFKVECVNGTTALRLEEDEQRAIEIFEKYYDLLDEAETKPKRKR